ncbi:MAG: hypothetical protein RR614_15160, partial [Eubacterium sp.]
NNISSPENEDAQIEAPLLIEPEIPAAFSDFDDIPTEHPTGAANTQFGEISALLNEAENLIDVSPYNRYIATQAPRRQALDDLSDDEPEIEASEDDHSHVTVTEVAAATENLDRDEKNSNAFDAFFEEDEDEETEIEEDEAYEEEPLAFEAEAHDSLDYEDEDDLFEEDELEYTEEDIPEAENEAPYAAFFKDKPAETEDFFDNLPLDKAPEEEHSENNLDDVTYENVDAQSLGAFKYSAVSLRLALFVISMLGIGVFTALSSGKFIAMDYLILLVLCICTVLTMDMSLNATLIVTVILMLASFGGVAYTFITGGGFDLYHLFWFILIPAVLITASS